MGGGSGGAGGRRVAPDHPARAAGFGRVDDQRCIPTSNPNSPTDRFQLGYDRDGNVLYKNNLVNSAFSELYHASSTSAGDSNSAYDSLDRLTGFLRGTLSASGNNASTLDTVTSPSNTQGWNLDSLGAFVSGAASSFKTRRSERQSDQP